MSKIYRVKNNKIYIDNIASFCIKHICECGQLFRFERKNEHFYTIFSKNNYANVVKNENGYEIECSNVEYFINYFDLDNDYESIKSRLKNSIMKDAVEYGYGIRILKQDLFEMIISFIISANNNIKRIQKTINAICAKCGKDMGGYYAFPTLESIGKCDEEFFKSVGAGYRAGYLVDTIKKLQTYNLERLKALDTESARKELMSFKGIGRKVADCILLFGLNRQDVFPVDTWIEKVYRDYYFAGEKSREQISVYLTNLYKDLSGYAQQYLFYYKRELE